MKALLFLITCCKRKGVAKLLPAAGWRYFLTFNVHLTHCVPCIFCIVRSAFIKHTQRIKTLLDVLTCSSPPHQHALCLFFQKLSAAVTACGLAHICISSNPLSAEGGTGDAPLSAGSQRRTDLQLALGSYN